MDVSPSTFGPEDDGLVRAFDIHSRITIYLIENLDPAAWRAEPPGGKGRNIAALAAHIHTVHGMWLKASGSTELPIPLNKITVMPDEAIAGLRATSAALSKLIATSLKSGNRVKNFKPDTAAFVGYLIAHDSHHRGQMATLARQVGFPLSRKVNFGLWEWGVR
ncbi:hypothetical protein ACPOL_2344 [Acidisarcina polymorpha]|uniref:DinB family protein n=1 Tax=Acidisarcina polymorpha TaxID=2211140 RepID=A0A2Z5FXQ9_9BACT|nr:DinB family protein [Acidisarcina polymorpha]AXC11668.1 hypothetical protein ACPOL_2344 [Acidisarcina polymorpha]